MAGAGGDCAVCETGDGDVGCVCLINVVTTNVAGSVFGIIVDVRTILGLCTVAGNRATCRTALMPVMGCVVSPDC